MPKPSSKLIVSTSYHSGGNIGDVAALLALKQFLARIKAPFDVEVLSSSSSKLMNLDGAYSLEELNRELVEYCYRNANLLMVIGGGAFFGSRTIPKLEVFIRQLKMKTALFCIGNDAAHNELVNEEKAVLGDLVKNVSHISLRSPFAHNMCLKMDIKPTEEKPLGDIVHLLESGRSFYNLKEDGHFCVGVSLRTLWNDEGYYTFIAQVLDKIVQVKEKVKIFFLPMSILVDDDTTAHLKVFNQLKNKDKAVLVRQYIYAPYLQDIFSQMDLMIGMRLHANVMAYNVETPFVAVDYHPKIKGFLEHVGLPDQYLVTGAPHLSNFYGYEAPKQYPHVDQAMEVIKQALEKSPSISVSKQKKLIEDKLVEVLKKDYPL